MARKKPAEPRDDAGSEIKKGRTRNKGFLDGKVRAQSGPEMEWIKGGGAEGGEGGKGKIV